MKNKSVVLKANFNGRDKKKQLIRQDIVTAAKVYSENLAGKVFLYVYGDKYFEVSFIVSSFKHLTGVDSMLSSGEFYNYSLRGILTTEQFSFSSRHPLAVAKKKLFYLKQLPCLTNNLVAVVLDLTTATITYKIGLTNLSFTLGLVQDSNHRGLYVPRSLRTRDKAVENSNDAEFIDFILMREASNDKYSTVLYSDDTKAVPECVKYMLKDDLI